MARWFVDRLPQRGIPSVSLRRLLPEAQFVGCPDWEVSGCTDDHRRLDPGQVFVAIRDPRYDGHAFVREALDRGAAGVVVERPCPEAGRLQVVVDDARAAHARICQALAGDPSQQLATLGVTGTFGKTVTSLFVRSILEAAGLRCGLIGALGWSDGMTIRPLGAGIGKATAPDRYRTRAAAASGAGTRSDARRHLARGSSGAGVDPGLHGRSELHRGRDRGLRRGARGPLLRGSRLPGRGRDRRRRALRLAHRDRIAGSPGQGQAVPPDRARGRGGGQRRRPARRDPGRREPRRPPRQLRHGAPHPGGRLGADRAAGCRRLAVRAPRLRPAGDGRSAARSAPGRSVTPWPPRPWPGRWRSTWTPSSPGWRRSPASPGTRGRRRGPGLRRPDRRGPDRGAPGPGPGRDPGRRGRPGPLRPERRGEPGPRRPAGPWPRPPSSAPTG